MTEDIRHFRVDVPYRGTPIVVPDTSPFAVAAPGS
jgi:hypothetical protein